MFDIFMIVQFILGAWWAYIGIMTLVGKPPKRIAGIIDIENARKPILYRIFMALSYFLLSAVFCIMATQSGTETIGFEIFAFVYIAGFAIWFFACALVNKFFGTENKENKGGLK